MHLQEESADVSAEKDPDPKMTCEIMVRSLAFKSFCTSRDLRFSNVEQAAITTQAILEHITENIISEPGQSSSSSANSSPESAVKEVRFQI